ncbi:hypothetical protein D3C72_1895680 [compost metagenome]
MKISSTSPWCLPGGMRAGAAPLAIDPMMRVATAKGWITRLRNCTRARARAATSRAVAPSVIDSSRAAAILCSSMCRSISSSSTSRNSVMELISGT